MKIKLIERYMKMSDDELLERYSNPMDYSLDALVIMSNEVKERNLKENEESEKAINEHRTKIIEKYKSLSEKEIKKICKKWDSLGVQELTILKEVMSIKDINSYEEINNYINGQNKDNKNIRTNSQNKDKKQENYTSIFFVYLSSYLLLFLLSKKIHISFIGETLGVLINIAVLLFILEKVVLENTYDKFREKSIFVIKPFLILFLEVISLVIFRVVNLLLNFNISLDIKFLPILIIGKLTLILFIFYFLLRVMFFPLILIEENMSINLAFTKSFKVTKNKMKYIFRSLVIFVSKLFLVGIVIIMLMPLRIIDIGGIYMVFMKLISFLTLNFNNNLMTTLFILVIGVTTNFVFYIFISKKYFNFYKLYFSQINEDK